MYFTHPFYFVRFVSILEQLWSTWRGRPHHTHTHKHKFELSSLSFFVIKDTDNSNVDNFCAIFFWVYKTCDLCVCEKKTVEGFGHL